MAEINVNDKKIKGVIIEVVSCNYYSHTCLVIGKLIT